MAVTQSRVRTLAIGIPSCLPRRSRTEQNRNRLLLQQISSTIKLFAQIDLLEQIGVVRLGTIDNLPSLWDETIWSFGMCENDGLDI